MREFTLLVLIFTLAVNAEARGLTVQEKLSDLDQVFSMVRSGYGPLHYKKKVIGLDLDRLRESYAAKARATRTNEEFYYLITQLIPEFKDSHFSARVPTDRVASVAFATDLVDGKVLIDTIERKKLPESAFPFQKGDEILAVDGQEIGAVLAQLQTRASAGYDLTARRRSAMRLTSRSGAIVPVPTGDVVFRIRHGLSSAIDEVTLKWNVQGELLDFAAEEKLEPKLLWRRSSPSSGGYRDFDDLSTRDLWEEFKGPRAERGYSCSGATRIEIPKDAVKVIDEPFVAYYFPTARGNIGYLRIPHYYWEAEKPGERSKYEEVFAQYEYALAALEKNTVGLIIDQDHNCGGSVEFLEKMVGLFMDRPYQAQQFRLLANKQEYLSVTEWVKETPEFTLAHSGLERVLGLLKDAWLAGEFMTPLTSLTGTDILSPNPVHYTKPIVMLIDEMSGSGGDAFPSLLQGYGRAKLIGTRTMGAGGHVEEQPPLFYSRIQLNMTKSLFYRPDGVAIENNGSVPDYPYTITRDDFLYGYRDYRAFALARLFEQLP